MAIRQRSFARWQLAWGAILDPQPRSLSLEGFKTPSPGASLNVGAGHWGSQASQKSDSTSPVWPQQPVVASGELRSAELTAAWVCPGKDAS